MSDIERKMRFWFFVKLVQKYFADQELPEVSDTTIGHLAIMLQEAEAGKYKEDIR